MFSIKLLHYFPRKVYIFTFYKTSSARMRVDYWFLCKFWVIIAKNLNLCESLKLFSINTHSTNMDIAVSLQWRQSAVVRYDYKLNWKEYVYIHIQASLFYVGVSKVLEKILHFYEMTKSPIWIIRVELF